MMRLWSLHPRYLDSKCLKALWRDGLLAQELLMANAADLKIHPQLFRFRKTTCPLGAIATYLLFVADEAEIRNYKFDINKIIDIEFESQILVSDGQMEYELKLLLGKVEKRDPELFAELSRISTIEANPLFKILPGKVENWEMV